LRFARSLIRFVVVEELPGCVHGVVEGCDFDFMGMFVKQCAVLFLIVNNEFFFFLVAEFVQEQQFWIVWVFLFPCGYGVLEFLYFESQTCGCGRGVWMYLFWVVRCFWDVCVRSSVSVTRGGEDGRGSVM